jgi:hypothetical protein
MGNQVLAVENIKAAAQIGDKEAQNILKRRGIEW